MLKQEKDLELYKNNIIIKKKLFLNFCYLKIFKLKNFFLFFTNNFFFNLFKQDILFYFNNKYLDFFNKNYLISKIILKFNYFFWNLVLFFNKFKIIKNKKKISLFKKRNLIIYDKFFLNNFIKKKNLINLFLINIKKKKLLIKDYLIYYRKKLIFYNKLNFIYNKKKLNKNKKFKKYYNYKKIKIKLVSLILKILNYINYLKKNLLILKFNKNYFLNLLKSPKIILKKIHNFRKKYNIRKLSDKKKLNFGKFKLLKINLNYFNNYFELNNKIIQFFIFLNLKVNNKKLFEKINLIKLTYTYLKIIKYFYKKLNLIYKDYYYYCFLKKTRSNTFLTITNRIGEVLYSYSIGRYYNLKKRKKRKSIKSLNFLIRLVSKKLYLKNIRYIHKLYLQNYFKRYFTNINREFLKYNIKIKNLIYIKKKPHSLLPRSKKLRRI